MVKFTNKLHLVTIIDDAEIIYGVTSFFIEIDHSVPHKVKLYK